MYKTRQKTFGTMWWRHGHGHGSFPGYVRGQEAWLGGFIGWRAIVWRQRLSLWRTCSYRSSFFKRTHIYTHTNMSQRHTSHRFEAHIVNWTIVRCNTSGCRLPVLLLHGWSTGASRVRRRGVAGHVDWPDIWMGEGLERELRSQPGPGLYTHKPHSSSASNTLHTHKLFPVH